METKDDATWRSLVRQSIELTATDSDGRMVGQLGGRPMLPATMEWPQWPGVGPYSLIAAIDCAALSSEAIGFPTDGWLLFFHLDPEDDRVLDSDPEDYASGEAGRVLHVPGDAHPTIATPPDETHEYPRVLLRERVMPTLPATLVPRSPSPAVEIAFDARTKGRVPPKPEALAEPHELGHRLGGYPASLQGDVEYDMVDTRPGDQGHFTEAARWRLLAQFDTDKDAEMSWGDCGVLYWLIRDEDLAARRFDRARFTWQCC